ncbi:uncharacterized protein ZK673.1-like [Dendronephthya gigantea]|uniref:uncharacterized protein ZK673.1-like n=1 Tax=Dendronephthya gigantea TaxID=151771 RepID=UPI00106D658F|nr:uncharacterized protein ZK673.1-like [Dendronephthya gigantea]
MFSKSRFLAAFVLSMCVFLSGLHVKGTNAATIRQAVTTVPPSTTQAVTRNTTANSTTTEACADENRSCSRWFKFGYCYNGYVFGYMRKVCKKTCGFCGHMTAECRDKYYYCPTWVRRRPSACTMTFYQIRCPYTCDACEE